MGLRLWSSPFALIVGAPCPPPLPRQAVAFAHHKHGKRWPPFGKCYLVNLIQRLADRAHLWPCKPETKVQQQLRVADCPAIACALLENCLNPRNIVQRGNIRRGIAQEFF